MLLPGTSQYEVLRKLPEIWESLSESEKLRAQALILELRETLENEEGLKFFQPHGGQIESIANLAKPGVFICIDGAGNGWGKTELKIAQLAACIWPLLAPPAFAQHQFYSEFPYPKRARIISTPKEVEEIGAIQTAIAKYFPRSRYESQKKGKAYPSQFKTDTGWIIDVMTYEQDKGEFAGPNIGITIFNEPPPEEIWKESLARTRSGGVVTGGMTSLLENPWIVDGVFSKHNGKDIIIRYGDVEENCKDHGKGGHLTHDQIEKILSQYDPDEREARKTGRPLSFSGRILKGFSRDIHVQELPMPEEATIYNVIDPATGKPFAIIWAWADVRGKFHIYDEWPDFPFEGSKDLDMGVNDYVSLLKAREPKAANLRILDRHFGNTRRGPGGPTLKAEFAASGLHFTDSYSVAAGMEVEQGILTMKDCLRYAKDKPIDSANFPRLTIDPKCTNTIAALERWARDPKTGRPQEEYKDFADTVRYLCKANPRHYVDNRNWNVRPGGHYGV